MSSWNAATRPPTFYPLPRESRQSRRRCRACLNQKIGETKMKNFTRRHPYLVAAGTGVAALLLGVGIGTSPEAQSAPEVKTVTITKTETKKVEVTPKACETAIEQAGEIQGLYSKVLTVAADYPIMIGEAAQAGLDVDVAKIDELTRRLDEGTQKLDGLNADIDDITPKYLSAVDECLSA